MDDKLNSSKELISIVSHGFRIYESVLSNFFQDFHTIIEAVNELGLLTFIPNVSRKIIHVSQHPQVEFILKDVVTNWLSRKLMLDYIVTLLE